MLFHVYNIILHVVLCYSMCITLFYMLFHVYNIILHVVFRITVPTSWVRFTQENIARSQKERELSEALRGQIDALLRACANEMWTIFNGVNNSFNARIQESTDARNKLNAHLSKVGTLPTSWWMIIIIISLFAHFHIKWHLKIKLKKSLKIY